jgi:exopolysaccharide biosynthesis WecB/TagA/CpsF family protein
MPKGGSRQAGRPESLREAVWSQNFAALLASDIAVRRGGTLTWFNHYSVQRSLAAEVDVSRFRYVGIDGLLLRRLALPTAPRTSADLVLPLVLDRLRPGSRIALIGSTAENLRAVTALLEALPSAPKVVYARDGFAGLASPESAARDLRKRDAQLVVVGLGAPLQDQYALQLADAGVSGALIATCGGWLDQVTTPDYYPRFAYHAKLNWAVRLVREPRRLWRRYTVDAVRARWRQAELRDYLVQRGGGPLAAMVSACTSPLAQDNAGSAPAVAS